MHKISLLTLGALLCLLFLAFSPKVALADGTETLGEPSVPVATGTGIIAAGTGMAEEPGTITITVPTNAVVKQALLYWEGQMATDVVGDPTIRINGTTEVTGALIGGKSFFFSGAYSSAYRADITALNVIVPGANSITLDSLDYTKIANGAGILVIYDDGSAPATIGLRDGLDLAFINFPEPRKSTVLQTFTFASATVSRTANIAIFASSVAGKVSGLDQRPDSIEITIDGNKQIFTDLLHSNNGDEWDTINLQVEIPAGATTLSMQLFSRDDDNTGNLPASMAWLSGAFAIMPQATAAIDLEKATNGEDADLPTGPQILAGDTVTWTYVVTNIGEVTLTDVTVTDDQIGAINCPQTTLAVDASMTCMATGTAVAGQYVNNATVVGTPINGAPNVTDSDPSHYFGLANAAIMLEKATNGEDADDPTGPQIKVGDPVTWTYVVTNIGTITLTNVTLTDDQLGTVTCPQNILAPSASMICTATGSATEGQYENLGTVVGTPTDGGSNVTDTDPSHYIGYLPAAVGNLVFGDINPNGATPADIAAGNGLQDNVAQEQGIPGIIVKLYRDCDTLVGTMTTGDDGTYLFDDLPPGDYCIVFVNPGTGIWTTPNVGQDDAIDSDAVTTVDDPDGVALQTATFSLASGQTDLTWDAGLIGLSGAASAAVGNRVWVDANRNGLQDPGEAGFPGATVRLFAADGTLLQTVQTDDQGIYGFESLDPGSYYIEFVPPANYALTEQKVGNDDELDSDVNPDTNLTVTFTLVAFETNPRFDLGLVVPTALNQDDEPLQQQLFIPLIQLAPTMQ